ncbi:MAG: hypothetical protein ABIW49_08230 [Knoellia sp.]
MAEWMQRPRRPWLDAVPATKFVQAMWAFPFVALGFSIHWLLTGERPEGHVSHLAFSGVALVELTFFILWFQRPVLPREMPERPRPMPSTTMPAPRSVATPMETWEAVEADAVWVLEGFDRSGHVTRWVVDGLEDEEVRRHLGWVPEGLWPATNSLLDHLQDTYGVEVDPKDFVDLLVGKEARAPKTAP